jgi:hypothetical protein
VSTRCGDAFAVFCEDGINQFSDVPGRRVAGLVTDETDLVDDTTLRLEAGIGVRRGGDDPQLQVVGSSESAGMRGSSSSTLLIRSHSDHNSSWRVTIAMSLVSGW